MVLYFQRGLVTGTKYCGPPPPALAEADIHHTESAVEKRKR